MNSQMKDHPLGIAARYNDAEAEEHGLEYLIDKLDLTVVALKHAAEQRALRSVLISSGRVDEVNTTRPAAIVLTPGEQRLMNVYAACYMDGILLGWRAGRIYETGG